MGSGRTHSNPMRLLPALELIGMLLITARLPSWINSLYWAVWTWDRRLSGFALYKNTLYLFQVI